MLWKSIDSGDEAGFTEDEKGKFVPAYEDHGLGFCEP